jgi:YHS domain-containing protein
MFIKPVFDSNMVLMDEGETMIITVCGSEVDKDDPESSSVTLRFEGKEYVFCEEECKKEFLAAKNKKKWLAGHK